MRETLAARWPGCRPLIAQQGLGPAFIDPALPYLHSHGAEIRFDHQLRKLDFAGDRVEALDFGEPSVKLAAGDAVILAVPGSVARLMLPGVATPTTYRGIVNAHFKQKPPPGFPQLLGVINGTAEWLFSFPDRISATISAADRWIETSREDLAQRIWGDIRQAHRPQTAPCRHGSSRRAPGHFCGAARRELQAADGGHQVAQPLPRRRLDSHGTPATIEGAIRSGNAAAGLALDAGRSMQGSSAR